MAEEPVLEESNDSMWLIHSHFRAALNIYLQGLVMAVFGAVFYVLISWFPLEYKAAGFIIGFLIDSYVLVSINSGVTMRFWAQDFRFSRFTVLGQGVVLLFVCILVLTCATTVVTIQIEGGTQIDPFFQLQMGLGATLISPPFYGLLARNVASWKISPFD